MADDPMEPLKILAQRAVEELGKLGLTVENFAALPNLGDGPHMAQIVVSFDGETVAAVVDQDEDQKRVDAEFAELMKMDKKAEQAEKESAAAEGLRRLAEELGEGKGILGDDDK